MSTDDIYDGAELGAVVFESIQARNLDGERRDATVGFNLSPALDVGGRHLRMRVDCTVEAGDVEVHTTIDVIYRLREAFPATDLAQQDTPSFITEQVMPTVMPYLREVAASMPARLGKPPVLVDSPDGPLLPVEATGD